MLPVVPVADAESGAPEGSVAKNEAATVPVDRIVPVVIPLLLIDVDPNVSVPPIVAFDVMFKPVPDGLLSVSVSAISAGPAESISPRIDVPDTRRPPDVLSAVPDTGPPADVIPATSVTSMPPEPFTASPDPLIVAPADSVTAPVTPSVDPSVTAPETSAVLFASMAPLNVAVPATVIPVVVDAPC